MQAPLFPENELARLKALRERAILDTLPEERFDRITRIAKRVFGTQIALVSLVDAERQWFKSKQGLDACETGRDISFCGHAILAKDIFHIANASLDPRFADNPLVVGPPNIRFYAGAPLTTTDGFHVGTLCIIDDKPRQLTTQELAVLRDLADCVEDEINQFQERQILAQLTTSRERSQNILRALPDMVFVVNRDGLILDSLEHPELLAPAAELIGRSLTEFLPPSLAAQCMQAIEQTLATGKLVAFEYRLDLPTGPAQYEARLQRIAERETLILIRNVSTQKNAEAALAHQKQLAEVIARAQSRFISDDDRRGAFDTLLTDIISLTESEYGFIAQVIRTPTGEPYLRSFASTNIAWDAGTRAFYEASEATGLEFHNLNTLFGAALTSGKTVIANDPYHDPRRGGLPEGHPALNAFLGIPIYTNEQLTAILGIANRPGGYDQTFLDFLQPLLTTIGQLVKARKNREAQLESEAALANTSALLADVLNAASEVGIIAANAEGLITVFNRGAERLLGYSADEVIGKQSPALFHVAEEVIARGIELSAATGHAVTGFRTFIEIPEQQGAERREWTYVRKTGEKIAVSSVVTPIRAPGSGEITGYLGIANDISERQRNDRLKSEFISTVSHELRTPLTAISGALGLLAGGALGVLPDKSRHMIDIAYKNSQRLTYLINDLLDMEKLVAGKVHFDMQPHFVSALVEQALEANRTYGAERRVNLALTRRPENDLSIRVDSQRLMQVLSNLISNAVKYSPPDGAVDVAVERQGKSVRVTVTDHGPGIPDKFRSRIFQKFSQADSSDTRQRGGTGLGLAITRELIERMGGQIGFDSVEGQGASFYFVLPVLNSPTANDAVEPALAEPSNAPRVLVVEDEPDIALLLALLLTRAGYTVDTALNGTDALRALQRTSYAAITLDLMLPDIGGLDIIRQVRQQPETATLPIIVLSAKMEEGRLAMSGDFSDIDWLAKPINENHLLSALEKHLLGADAHRPRILHVEDDTDLQAVIRATLGERVDFESVGSLQQARTRLMQARFDLILLDLTLPDGSGWDLLPVIRGRQPNARVVILTGTDSTPEQARKVEAVLLKSHVSPSQLLDTLNYRIRLGGKT